MPFEQEKIAPALFLRKLPQTIHQLKGYELSIAIAIPIGIPIPKPIPKPIPIMKLIPIPKPIPISKLIPK